jgi:hypothetical protein
MTEQQGWIKIGQLFEMLYVTGESTVVSEHGLCTAVSKLRGLSRKNRGIMLEKLCHLHDCTRFWYKRTQANASWRANTAYLLAAGMAAEHMPRRLS